MWVSQLSIYPVGLTWFGSAPCVRTSLLLCEEEPVWEPGCAGQAPLLRQLSISASQFNPLALLFCKHLKNSRARRPHRLTGGRKPLLSHQ